jgi:RNA polymerase sigma-70 factor (ECF subfamily)
MELTDEALIAAIRVGDKSGLALLFRRHQAALHRFCTRLVGPRGDVEDLMQNTFLAAWSNAGSYRGQASAVAWLYGIAANLHRRSLRSTRRTKTFLERLQWRPGPRPLPIDDEVSNRQLMRRLASAIDELPHDLRVVFLLCEMEGISGTDAARALGLRPGTVWRRLHDARKRLLSILERGDLR